MAYFDQQNIQKRAQQPIGPSQGFMDPNQNRGQELQGQAEEPPKEEQGQEQDNSPNPAWDRTAFRDAWMSSGVQNVPDMQNWLKTTGWGKHVGTAGSKGDVMQLPSGENIDAVLAAGLGGNRGGPQWTGKGSWNQQGGQMESGGMSPSPDMMQQWLQMIRTSGGQQPENQMHANMSRTQQMQGMGQQGARAMKQSSGPYRQGLGPTQGQQQQKMTGYQTKPLVPQH